MNQSVRFFKRKYSTLVLTFLILIFISPVSLLAQINWKLVTDKAEFAGRSKFGLINFHGKMWVLNGFYSSNSFPDIWNSSDGKTWKRVLETAPYPARMSFTTHVFKEQIWIFGGKDIC